MNKFSGDFALQADKKKNLEKIKEEKEARKVLQFQESMARKIQKWWRVQLRKYAILKEIKEDMTKKLSDLDKVEIMMKNQQKEFFLPLQINMLFVKNSYILVKFFSKFVPRIAKSKTKRDTEKIKQLYSVVEKTISWTAKSLSITRDSLLSGTISPGTDKLKIYSQNNLKKLLRISFWVLDLMNSSLAFYQTSLVNAILNFINQLLTLTSKCKEFSIYPIFKTIEQVYEERNPLYTTDKKVKIPLLKIWGTLLQKILSTKKDYQSDEKVFQIIESSALLTQLYNKIENKKRSRNDYAFHVKLQSEFFIYLISIPRFSRFIRLSCSEEKPFLYGPPNARFWRDIFQSFLFWACPDPLTGTDFNAGEILKKFDSNNALYFGLGNVIEIFNFQIANLGVEEWFSGLRILCLLSYNLTSAWLSSIMGYFDVDKEYWCLKDQYNRLFDSKVIEKIFEKMFSQTFILKEENKLGDKIFETSTFFSDIGWHLIELYSLWLSFAHQGEGLQHMISNFCSSISFNKAIVRRLYHVFIEEFGEPLKLKNFNHFRELPDIAFGLLNVFITVYYHFLLITDSEEFLVSNHFTKVEIISITKTLLKASTNVNWNFGLIAQSKQKVVFANQSSKLLKLINETNAVLQLITQKDMLVEESTEKLLVQEISERNHAHLPYLKRMPFTVSFEARLALLDQLIITEKENNMMTTKMTIRRTQLFDDGLEAFTNQMNKMNLKGRLAVVFVDEFGYYEQGVDAGGLFKEFLNELSKIIFNPGYGLFKLTEDQTLYPNPDSFNIVGADHLKIFYFVGLVVGRAIYDNILIETEFSQFFLRKMLGKINSLNELQTLDKEMYNNLKFLKTYQGDIKDLCLTFSATDSNNTEIELIPGGKDIAVTNHNRFKYIYLMANNKLHTEIKGQVQAFLSGLNVFIPLDWLQLFTEEELQIVISGAKKPFDINDLKRHTVYKGYSSFESYMSDFWKVFEELSEEDKILLLKFVTSCSRPPLLGFAQLNPPFTIQKADNDDGERLPTASTCFNTLKLPKYNSKKKLKEKLSIAFKSSTGFGLM